MKSIRKFFLSFAMTAMVFFASACSIDTAKKHYVLAENLWNEGQYDAAVIEFQKVIAQDPKGKLGLQATFRAAMTEELFLSRYLDAIKKFQSYAEMSADPATAWDARMRVGEILFAKLENYDQAVQHYEKMLKDRPDASEAGEIQFRIAKSYFFLMRFENAIHGYRRLIKASPKSVWAENAAFEIGAALYTWGSQQKGRGDGSSSELLEEAIDSYQRFVRAYPKSKWLAEAQFGIAECYEELDQLDMAYHSYDALKETYPSRNVVEIKLARIKERKAQRRR